MTYMVRPAEETGGRAIVNTVQGTCLYLIEGKVKELVDVVEKIYERTKVKQRDNQVKQDEYSEKILSRYKVDYPPRRPAPMPGFKSFLFAYAGVRLITINGKYGALTEEDTAQLFRVAIDFLFKPGSYKTVSDMALAIMGREPDRLKISELASLLDMVTRGAQK